MTLKAVLAAAIAVAVVVGFCLPAAHQTAEPRSQIDQLDVGRR